MNFKSWKCKVKANFEVYRSLGAKDDGTIEAESKDENSRVLQSPW